MVAKTGFLQKLLTCFRGGFEGMVCDFGILRAATVASMTALPRSSDAVLAAYERGGVYGIAVAEATKQQWVAVARTTGELVVTGGRLRAASDAARVSAGAVRGLLRPTCAVAQPPHRHR